jgi:alpha-mannosidase
VLEAELSLEIPVSSDRSGRDDRTAQQVVTIEAIVDAGAATARLRLAGENSARDHRLRLIVSTGIAGGNVHADAAFGAVSRKAQGPASSRSSSPDSAEAEKPIATAPLHRYVTIADERRGVTLISDGLAEYEADSDGRIFITLLRAIGELSRADLPERPGHAGWPTPIAEAQCIGPWEAEVSIMPHGPRDAHQIAEIERAAEDVLLPLVGSTVLHFLDVPPERPGIELAGEGLAFSACKRSEDGSWMVLRCVNLLDAAVEGAWQVHSGISEAMSARLDETPEDQLPHSADTVGISVPARGVLTILVR